MGLWDFISSLFGGGAKMEVSLDAEEIPVGGILSGKARLIGASKDYPVTNVKVQLVYVHTEVQEDSPLPKIDMRVLLDNTLTAGDSLAAGEEKEYSFTFQIPGGTEPTAHNVSYQIKVVADIPGIKDPNAVVKLKVREADEGAGTTSLEALYDRWPALRGSAEQPLIDALRDMRWSHSDYDETKNLSVAEPLLARFMREGAPRVRVEALETWSNIVGDEARKSNIETLSAILGQDGQDEDFLSAALDAAAKFADAGGIKLMVPFADHESAALRAKVADALQYRGSDNAFKLRILEKFITDEDAQVRNKAVRGLDDFMDKPAIVDKVVALAQTETDAGVLEGVLWCIRSAFYQGGEAKALAVFDAASQSVHPNVRKTAADCISSATGYADITAIVLRLLADTDEDVRDKMAYEIQNFGDEHTAPFKDALRNLADNDPVKKVRTSAIDAMQSVLPKEEVVAYYRSLMANEPEEHILRGVVHGIKFEEDPEYKELLKELSGCPFPRVAKEAKSGYEFNR